jgi:hypothetical protein
MHDILAKYTFSTRVDEGSVQISCEEDPRFWFRMVPTAIQNVTDFYLGAFPKDGGALLLKKCFDLVDHARDLPKPSMSSMTSIRLPPVIIYSNLSGPDAVENSRSYEGFTRDALASYGRKIVHGYLNARHEKRDLYLITDLVAFP